MPRPLLVTQQPQIGHLIRDLRQQLNLSHVKLARLCGALDCGVEDLFGSEKSGEDES